MQALLSAPLSCFSWRHIQEWEVNTTEAKFLLFGSSKFEMLMDIIITKLVQV